MKTPFFSQSLKQMWCTFWGHSEVMRFQITKCDGNFPAALVIGSCPKCCKNIYGTLKINWEELNKLPLQNLQNPLK